MSDYGLRLRRQKRDELVAKVRASEPEQEPEPEPEETPEAPEE